VTIHSDQDVSLDREAIKTAPAYDEDGTFDREDEFAIYDHYGRRPYWRNKRESALA